jgi:hypothetical protein
MTRTVFVFMMAALICLALTGLRVAALQHLSSPGPLLAPRTIKDPQPPAGERPIEYIAIAPAPRDAPQGRPALIWAGALRGREAGAPRAE